MTETTKIDTVLGDQPVARSPLSDREKVYDLVTLSPLLESLRRDGARIVQCHGVFDLLHVGHLRHLRAARAFGDYVVVSLTADAYVNKGPHRPAFTDTLRAEALAALSCVDFVTISPYPTAIEAIEAIRPDVYVKGQEYRIAADDVTGGIVREEEAIKRVGGRLAYTDDIVFSSSQLLNRHLSTFAPEVQQYLNEFRSTHTSREVIGWIDRLRGMHVTVVGEAILDEYLSCEQMGKSAKDPVLAMRYQSGEVYAGGSLAVANHLANFVDSVELITYLGEKESEENFIRMHLKPNVRANFLYKKDSPTIVKRRYVESHLGTKLFEVYFMNDEPLRREEEQQLCSLLAARVPQSDVVVAADFGHGLLTQTAIEYLGEKSRFLAVNTQINAANIRYHAISSYRRADYVCINEQELRLDARSRHGDLAHLIHHLAGRLAAQRVMVTRGRSGVSYCDAGSIYSSPAFASQVVDRIGSGDAVLAITSVAAAAGAPPAIIAFLANVIGAQKVQIIGNRSSVDRVATIKCIESLLK